MNGNRWEPKSGGGAVAGVKVVVIDLVPKDANDVPLPNGGYFYIDPKFLEPIEWEGYTDEGKCEIEMSIVYSGGAICVHHGCHPDLCPITEKGE